MSHAPPSLLSPTAAEFSPGQTAHPSPASSERFPSPTPHPSVLNSQPQYQLQTLPQQYCGQQTYYGYQPYPLYDGYSEAYNPAHNQAYDLHVTPPTYYAYHQGSAWTPEQNSYVGYSVDPSEPFAVQFNELQGVRNGQVPRQNTWNNYGTGNSVNNRPGNVSSRKNARKNQRKNLHNKGRPRVGEQDGQQNVDKQADVKAHVEVEVTETEADETKVKTELGVQV